MRYVDLHITTENLGDAGRGAYTLLIFDYGASFWTPVKSGGLGYYQPGQVRENKIWGGWMGGEAQFTAKVITPGLGGPAEYGPFNISLAEVPEPPPPPPPPQQQGFGILATTVLAGIAAGIYLKRKGKI